MVARCLAGRGPAARRSLFPWRRRGGVGAASGSAGPPPPGRWPLARAPSRFAEAQVK